MNFKSYTSHEVEELSRSGIYAIVNKINGKFYIGSAARKGDVSSASGFYARWHEHLSELNRSAHCSSYLQRAWNKYGGENFKFQILEFVSPEKCIEVEQMYLDLFPKGDRDTVYNTCFTAGSILGIKRSEEFVAKMSKAFEIISPEGDVVKSTNLKRFSRENNLCSSHLSEVIKGTRLQDKGWTATIEAHLLYKELYLTRGVSEIKRKSNQWRVFRTINGKQENTYFETKEAAIEYRDKLVSEGWEFKVSPQNWKKKLNA
jgi:group I intron endonuclease